MIDQESRLHAAYVVMNQAAAAPQIWSTLSQLQESLFLPSTYSKVNNTGVEARASIGAVGVVLAFAM